MNSETYPPENLLVAAEDAGTRLDHYLCKYHPEFSRVRWQNLIRDGHVLLNGVQARASEKLKEGMQISIQVPPMVEKDPLSATDLPLDILFEDNSLLVLNKAAGMVVHPGAGTDDCTLVNALLHHCKDLSGIGGVERPGIVHRLDKETSGCLVVAKDDFTHRNLCVQFADRVVEKVYLAVVKGVPKRPHGTIDAPIGRHPVQRQKMAVKETGTSRDAITEFTVLRSGDGMALIECHPKTGRTHQLRVHLKHFGHPILGDPLYGARGVYSRHLLHAWKLSFLHPSTGTRVSFVAPPPADFPLLPPGSS